LGAEISSPNSTKHKIKEEPKEVTDSKPKAVFILNPETQTFKPTAHNLGADLAMEQFSADPNAELSTKRNGTAIPMPRMPGLQKAG